jgi:hypothetical protein
LDIILYYLGYKDETMMKLKEKFSKLTLINGQNSKRPLTEEEIEKMLQLCQKRYNPSYYKLRHATGVSEEYSFKGIDYYIVENGKKRMRRLWDD